MLRRPGVQMTLSGVRNYRGTALLSTCLPRSSAYRRSLSCSVVLSAANATAGPSFAACMVQCRSLVVETNETPNPDCLRFFSMDFSFLKPEFSMDIPSPAHAYKSPLAEALFGVEGVQAIFLADEYVTVRKDPQADWAGLVHIIKEVIAEFAESKENVLSEAGEAELMGYNDDTEPNDDDDEVILAVKELLATRIRPMLRADGGNVRFIDMDEGTVFLLLEGACKSCPSSHITLKSGIERMLMHWIPEVVEVQEVSDEVAADILSEKRLRKQMKEKGEIVEAK
ncbi:putative Scaffold protein Nfu/NifU N terminal/NifU-like domain containing protein [Leishmania naiffi]|uniref:Scaffold protein Nfu/NifU N terminal/NifU-like domain containing protein n=1 Tax=Leishmania naiffi TaxID=5678 RepID=A0AAW3BKQ5_9TRYP